MENLLNLLKVKCDSSGLTNMADMCVIYATEDEEVARKLVSLLRYHWDVWWAGEITHADWEQKVKASIKEIKGTSACFFPPIQKKRGSSRMN